MERIRSNTTRPVPSNTICYTGISVFRHKVMDKVHGLNYSKFDIPLSESYTIKNI